MTTNEYLPLGILVPMHEEVEQLLTEIEGAQTQQYANRTFHLGTLCGKSVVLAQSGIGKVASSFTASLLIHHFNVKALIVSGVAGGIADSVKVGDLAIAQEAVQHDMDCRPLFPQFTIPHNGISHYKTDLILTKKLEDACIHFVEEDFQTLISKQIQKELGIAKPHIQKGLLVSGDQFIGSLDQLGRIQQGLPETLFVEMEGAAVVQICHDSNIPFCSVRTISDKANDAAHLDFNKFLNAAAKIYTAGIIKRFTAYL